MLTLSIYLCRTEFQFETVTDFEFETEFEIEFEIFCEYQPMTCYKLFSNPTLIPRSSVWQHPLTLKEM